MNELYHWGIKGMKWGVRRYQDKNGRLTEAGLRRYRDSRNIRKDKLKLSDLHPDDARKVMQYLNEEIEWNRKLSELDKTPSESFGKHLVKKLIEGKVDAIVKGMGEDSDKTKKKKREEEIEFEKQKSRAKKWGEAVGKAEGEEYTKDKYEKRSGSTTNDSSKAKPNTGGGQTAAAWRVVKKTKKQKGETTSTALALR